MKTKLAAKQFNQILAFVILFLILLIVVFFIKGRVQAAQMRSELAAAEQRVAEQQAENGKRQPGHAEDLARLHGAAERVRLADHARERDRHTRRGHVKKDIINIIGNGEIAVSLVAENIAERDLIDRAEDLDDHNAGRYDGRAVEIVLLAAFLQSALPPR